jgi:hypothetical protein
VRDWFVCYTALGKKYAKGPYPADRVHVEQVAIQKGYAVSNVHVVYVIPPGYELVKGDDHGQT